MTLLIIIIVSLIFDYINGFHDAANAIATVRCHLTPQAVLWAAFFNFCLLGFVLVLLIQYKTANTMEITLVVILAGVTPLYVEFIDLVVRIPPVHLIL
jgi:PiT family inorganic phosphate transporter